MINNVETLAAARGDPRRRGAGWWKAQGVRGGLGLKFIAVSGDVARPGVYEIPMGTTVAELIALAGGVTGGPRRAAVPPGRRVLDLRSSAADADTPLDFEHRAGRGLDARLGRA